MGGRDRHLVRQFQRAVKATIGTTRPGVAATLTGDHDARGAAEGTGQPPLTPDPPGGTRFRFIMGHPVLGSIPADGEPWPWEL